LGFAPSAGGDRDGVGADRRHQHRQGSPGQASRRVRPFLLAALTAALAPLGAGAAPARAAAVCSTPALTQVFLPWGDPGWYGPVPDSGFEASPSGWTLGGGARVVSGNEPFYVGSAGDTHSLSLPSGAATSGAACIGLGHPTLRLFVRNTGAPDATLTVQVAFTDSRGISVMTPIGTLKAGPDWAPSAPLPIVANALSPVGVQQVKFVFTTPDPRGHWAIDDVYVDPYGKG
jgi:hypothetical protein